ncbi:hypothetical protein OB919_04285 [Halobacteria archaeon AArc-curdl1]|uniref:Halobacterial output domain-containing protein n=1 Tax=Natronosalvus hydrolyticus TaxID=2979988 RepID=A0AAP2Z6A7_9EURY|nr:hypothetical protein [Halobacteria archaeon AArc-curdl1]
MTERDDSTLAKSTEYGYDGRISPSVAVVLGIAEHEQCDPDILDFTLYEFVDPDALDSLVRGNHRLETNSTEVKVIVDDYDVSVQGDTVVVTDRTH